MEEDGICFLVSLCCELDANFSEAVLDLVTEVLLSSGLVLFALCFIRLWVSAFSLSQSLKSSRVGLTQCFEWAMKKPLGRVQKAGDYLGFLG